MSKDTQPTQRDSVLIINFQEDIPSAELENLSNNNVTVDYIDIKNSVTDLENIINGNYTNSKNYKKIIIKAHGSFLGTRDTEDETHYIGVNSSLNTGLPRYNNNQIKTEHFIKKMLLLYPNVDEIILDSCHAGALRNSHIPCSVTTLSSAKYTSLSEEGNQYIRWRLNHYNDTKDPCIAFGMASQLFPVTKTLILNDKNSKNSCQIKSIAPKDLEDINSTKKFLSNNSIAKNINSQNKTHKRHHIQIRKANPPDNTLLNNSIIKINKGKQDIALTDECMIKYIKNAVMLNGANCNFERVREYYMHCKNQYKYRIPIKSSLNMMLKSKAQIDKQSLAKSFFKIQYDIPPKATLNLKQTLHMYQYIFSVIDPFIDTDSLNNMFYDVKAKLYEACDKDKNIFKSQKSTIDNILAMMMCSNPQYLDELIKDLERKPQFQEYAQNSEFLQNYKKSATNILKKTGCYTIAKESFIFNSQKNKCILLKAQCAAQAKFYEPAKTICNNILKKDPSLENYYHAIDIFKDNPEIALPYIEHVKKIAPEKASNFYINLAEQSSNPLDAIKYYKKAIATNPSDMIKVSLYLETSTLALQTGNYDLVQQCSIKALDMLPYNVSSYKYFKTSFDKIIQENNHKMMHADKEKKSTHVNRLKDNPSRQHKLL